tara:strand:- start:228 stop:440 length:213 start_codon:yes stop_codon:yes gene_type:complete
MKAFQFIVDDKGGIADLEVVKAMSYKKAVKSFQTRHPELKIVGVYHPNKKGERLLTWQKLPMGRKKKIGR